ncbi:hypothetical protein [Peribacillus sp. NJ4]|uniref:hypothetical protein n=1 Tax=Peribacillus sp. NJ4 TaxID=3055862 RepID=UPI00259FFCEE|nr:hypothetical protein [Peribacillus sp. NJ4]
MSKNVAKPYWRTISKSDIYEQVNQLSLVGVFSFLFLGKVFMYVQAKEKLVHDICHLLVMTPGTNNLRLISL